MVIDETGAVSIIDFDRAKLLEGLAHGQRIIRAELRELKNVVTGGVGDWIGASVWTRRPPSPGNTPSPPDSDESC